MSCVYSTYYFRRCRVTFNTVPTSYHISFKIEYIYMYLGHVAQRDKLSTSNVSERENYQQHVVLASPCALPLMSDHWLIREGITDLTTSDCVANGDLILWRSRIQPFRLIIQTIFVPLPWSIIQKQPSIQTHLPTHLTRYESHIQHPINTHLSPISIPSFIIPRTVPNCPSSSGPHPHPPLHPPPVFISCLPFRPPSPSPHHTIHARVISSCIDIP